MATIPILKIKKFVDLLIAFVKADYENKTDKEQSFLYKILNDNEDDGWNFYTNAIEIFTRGDTDKRKLETRLMFDRSRAGLPTIHVREPSKSKGSYDGIGFEGEDYTTNEDETISDTSRKTFSSQFELVITSANSLECVMIQEVLESLLLSAKESLVLPFFDLIDFSSKELMMSDEEERSMLFMKSIILNIQYQKDNIPNIYTSENITTITFDNPTLLDF